MTHSGFAASYDTSKNPEEIIENTQLKLVQTRKISSPVERTNTRLERIGWRYVVPALSFTAAYISHVTAQDMNDTSTYIASALALAAGAYSVYRSFQD